MGRLGLVVLGSLLAATPAAAAGDAVLDRLIEDPACHVRQFDGIAPGGDKQDRILALFGCNGTTERLLLVAGAFPIPDASEPSAYKVLDKRDLAVAAGGTIDLAAGACSRHGKPLPMTVAVNGVWGAQKRISAGKGLIELVEVARDRRHLETMAIKDVSCSRDEP